MQIKDPGDTSLVEEELLTRERFQEENDRRLAANQQPATAAPILLGLSALAALSAGGLAQLYQEPGHKTLASLALQGKHLDL